MKREDYQVIIAWNSNPDVIKTVKDVFGENVILEKKIQLSKEERAKKINEVYHPIHVPPNSERCVYAEPLTLLLVKMEAKYRYFNRTEGYLLCNPDILDFKYKYRKQFDYRIFHCSDSITETLKALKVFDLLTPELEKEMKACSIVHVDNMFTIRHLQDKSFVVVPFKDNSIIQRLQGYEIKGLQQKYGFNGVDDETTLIVQQSTLDYLKELSSFDQEHEMSEITAYKNEAGQYIITDGMHRAATLYFQGNRHIFVKEAPRPCEPHLLENKVKSEPISHLEHLHQFIYDLHNQNIKFVVVRGWKTMPKTADTDLDMVIHPEDYAKFRTLMNQYIAKKKFAFNVEVPYSHPEYQAWYRAYRTLGSRDDFLTNKDYQFDTYNNIFFFGPNKTAFTLSKEFLNYLFANRKKHFQLYTPNEVSEMVLLYCRTYVDLNGNWKPKHKARFDELRSRVTKQEFVGLLTQALGLANRSLLVHVDKAFL